MRLDGLRVLEPAAARPEIYPLGVLRMAGEAGLRRGEVIGLRWPDLDPAARRVTVERAVWQERTRGSEGEAPRKIVRAPKGGRARRVAISDGIVEALGRWYERSVVERVLHRAGLVDATGRPLASFHGLRRTAASVMLVRGGAAPNCLAPELGHRNPNVTAEVYARLLHDAQLDEAMSAFAPQAGTVRELPERPRSRFGRGFSARRISRPQAEGRGFETRRPLLSAAVA